jgi:hypothetical protein
LAVVSQGGLFEVQAGRQVLIQGITTSSSAADSLNAELRKQLDE